MAIFSHLLCLAVVAAACKPVFDVPAGATARISIIDTTLRFSHMKASYLFSPNISGFDELPTLGSWSFLVESSKGEKVLFDLGGPKDRNRYSPAIVKKLDTSGWTVVAEKNVADILVENGLSPGDIQSVIWSHWHWDHIGDITTFPNSTELVVGPGFQDEFLPAWPTVADSPLRNDYFAGQSLREIDFTNVSTTSMAGTFRAYDFFGDGSFFLLDTPGHAVGHLGGLVRTTTNPDTFMFLAGDLCHHGSEIRPSQYLPYPKELPPAVVDRLQQYNSCPGSQLFDELNKRYGRSTNQPLVDPTLGEVTLALKTIKEAQPADALEHIFFIPAHDVFLEGIVDTFPLPANDWKQKGWKKQSEWLYLDNLVPAVINATL